MVNENQTTLLKAFSELMGIGATRYTWGWEGGHNDNLMVWNLTIAKVDKLLGRTPRLLEVGYDEYKALMMALPAPTNGKKLLKAANAPLTAWDYLQDQFEKLNNSDPNVLGNYAYIIREVAEDKGYEIVPNMGKHELDEITERLVNGIEPPDPPVPPVVLDDFFYVANLESRPIMTACTNYGSLCWSTDRQEWHGYVEHVEIPVAGKLYFYNTATGLNINCDGKFAIGGDARSIVEGLNFKDKTLCPASGLKGFFANSDLTNIYVDFKLGYTQLGNSSLEAMFKNCAQLTQVNRNIFQNINAIGYKSFASMFQGSGLMQMPTLPTLVAEAAYLAMFKDCTGLTIATMPNVTTMAKACYAEMFMSCTNLSSLPTLTATTLAEECYRAMFRNTGIVNIVSNNLPALDVPKYAYTNMFADCQKLVTPMATLPATHVGDQAYLEMFMNCPIMLKSPYIKALDVEVMAMQGMFSNCLALKEIRIDYPYQARLLPSGAFTDWAKNVAMRGDFYDVPEADWIAGKDGNPWLVENDFWTEAERGTIKIKFYAPEGTPASKDLQYKTDEEGAAWKDYTRGQLLTIEEGHRIYWRRTLTGHCSWTIYDTFDVVAGADDVLKLGGDIDSLSCGKDHDAHETLKWDYCYSYLFENINCKMDLDEFVLMAKTLSKGCYRGMFWNCTKLSSVPELFLATGVNLAAECYMEMFGQTAMVIGPKLPALALADKCYMSMYENCKDMTLALELPATVMKQYCYSRMYYGCDHVETMPTIAATKLDTACFSFMFAYSGIKNIVRANIQTLAPSCYASMFEGCEGLEDLSNITLPAPKAVTKCYYRMFKNCHNLVKSPQIGATTHDGTYCMAEMFANCEALNELWITGYMWQTSDALDHTFDQWLDDGVANVARYGEMHAPSIDKWPKGISGDVWKCDINITYDKDQADVADAVTWKHRGEKLTLTCTEKDLYAFWYWTVDGERVETNPLVVEKVENDMEIVLTMHDPINILVHRDVNKVVATYPAQIKWNTDCDIVLEEKGLYAFEKYVDADQSEHTDYPTRHLTNVTEDFETEVIMHDPCNIDITLSDERAGTISKYPKLIKWGTDVSFTVTPTVYSTDHWWEFDKWDDENVDNPRTLVHVEEDVTLVGLCSEWVKVYADVDPVRGIMTAPEKAKIGETIDLSVESTEPEHYIFKEWTDEVKTPARTLLVEDVVHIGALFDEQVAIEVEYDSEGGSVTYPTIALVGYPITLEATPGELYNFQKWVINETEYTDNPLEFVVDSEHKISKGTAIKLVWQDPVDVIIDEDPAFYEVEAPKKARVGSTITVGIKLLSETTKFIKWSDGNTQNPREILVGEDPIILTPEIDRGYTITMHYDETHFDCEYPEAVVKDQIVTFKAISLGTEYHFKQWDVVNTETGQKTSYTINPMTMQVKSNLDVTLVEYGDIEINITCPTDKGVVIGPTSAHYGQVISLEIKELNDYAFKSWSDGNTDNPREFIVTGPINLTVDFYDPIQIIVNYDPQAADVVVTDEPIHIGVNIDSTKATIDFPAIVKRGSDVTMQVVPIAPHTFKCWSDFVTENPRTWLALEEDLYIGVVMDEEVSINVIYDHEKGTIDYPAVANVGEEIALTVYPKSGYKFVKWTDGTTDNPKIVTVPEGGLSIGAEFAESETTNALCATLVKRSSTSYVGVVLDGGSFELEYSMDGYTWETAEQTVSLEMQAGDKIYFRRDFTGQAIGNKPSKITFRATNRNAEFVLSGDYRSLIQKEDFESLTSIPAAALYEIFDDRGYSVVSAPDFDKKIDYVDSHGCYRMFQDSGLVIAPTIYVVEAGPNAFEEMFDGCTYLLTPAEMPRLVDVSIYALTRMYDGCSSLMYSPDLSKVGSFYYPKNKVFNGMFGGCSKLSRIVAPHYFSTYEFYQWCNGVAGNKSIFVPTKTSETKVSTFTSTRDLVTMTLSGSENNFIGDSDGLHLKMFSGGSRTDHKYKFSIAKDRITKVEMTFKPISTLNLFVDGKQYKSSSLVTYEKTFTDPVSEYEFSVSNVLNDTDAAYMLFAVWVETTTSTPTGTFYALPGESSLWPIGISGNPWGMQSTREGFTANSFTLDGKIATSGSTNIEVKGTQVKQIAENQYLYFDLTTGVATIVVTPDPSKTLDYVQLDPALLAAHVTCDTGYIDYETGRWYAKKPTNSTNTEAPRKFFMRAKANANEGESTRVTFSIEPNDPKQTEIPMEYIDIAYKSITVSFPNIQYDETMCEIDGAPEKDTLVSPGFKATLECKPKDGYQFVGWRVNGSEELIEDNPWELTMTADITSIEAVCDLATVTVTTIYNEDECSITGLVEDPVEIGSQIQYTCVPKAGYKFTKWIVDGVDTSMNPMTWTVNEDMTIECVCADDRVTITNVYDEDQVTITGLVEGKVVRGTKINYTAVPKEGYEFVKWVVGSTDITTNPTGELTIIDDTTIQCVTQEEVQEDYITFSIDNTPTSGMISAGITTTSAKIGYQTWPGWSDPDYWAPVSANSMALQNGKTYKFKSTETSASTWPVLAIKPVTNYSIGYGITLSGSTDLSHVKLDISYTRVRDAKWDVSGLVIGQGYVDAGYTKAMFESFKTIVNPPKITATSLGNTLAPMQQMFSGCSSLVAAPELKISVLKDSCYDRMFYNCTSLTSAPALPATTLVSGCYNSMFQGCTSLEKAPVIPVTDVIAGCLASMFSGCSKLNEVYCHAETIAYNAFNNWLYGVAAAGTFHAKPGVEYWGNASGIPSGWTRVDDL